MKPGVLSQPMASMGGDRRPHPRTVKEQVAQAEADYRHSIVESGSLYEALMKDAALQPVVQLLEAEINQFLKTNEKCQGLLQVLARWRYIMVDGPRYAEDKLQRLMGPELYDIYKRTQAAP